MREIIFELSKKSPVICMVKKNNQLTFFEENVFIGGIEAVYRRLKNKKRGRSHIIGSKFVTLVRSVNGKVAETLKCKIVFVRHRSTGDWIPLLCTNCKYSDEKIVTLYGMRWQIEVFHRDVKQFLALEKGCQSTDYDSLTANVTIVYTRYIFLSYRRRMREDKRKMGIGSVFYACCEEIRQISYEEAVLRACADAYEALKSMTAAAHTKTGEAAYTKDQVLKAIIDSGVKALQEKSDIEVTMISLIQRQKEIERFGACLALRLKGMLDKGEQAA